MKKVFLAALLALPLFAVAAKADGCWFPQRVDARVDFHFRVAGPGDYQPTQLGPWYLYWPLEAHFQTPAPTGYPYWPSPMVLPQSMGVPAPGNFQPASYNAPAPYYWSR